MRSIQFINTINCLENILLYLFTSQVPNISKKIHKNNKININNKTIEDKERAFIAHLSGVIALLLETRCCDI